MLESKMGDLWFALTAQLAMVIIIVNGSNLKGCDLFKGSWVYDKTYPLYKNCPFLGRGFDCLKNGRLDRDYLMYKWKPLACDIPRFNGRDFLEKLKGKKLMFVGDSLSFNQWESLTCLLHSAVPKANYTLQQRGSLSIFSFEEYGVSLMVLKDGFLVDMIQVEKIGRVLKLDSISRGNLWLGYDILIFNSFHWWTHRMDYYQVDGKVIKNMNFLQAYKIAMTTWRNWVDSNIDHTKTKVFFQGVSATHLNGSEWHKPNATCHGETNPIKGSIYPGGSNPGEVILNGVLSRMKSPVYLLDITLLTQLRKDGHPSLYAGSGSSSSLMDCSHWCLPGVPDAWNELLYAGLFYQ